ncbi:LysE/ArgO family amino acid transporter [Blastococcus sp. TF02A-35]|uniref:LysE/ArgO family amino acid transporter n=1 Tax=Blastococcus sp. TF02A-35 TaxID=2559612 RepID=UPI00107396E8|nr:LysE/ArgO family amino acid transporter [Blastococcus sp. TF02A_35]TFV52310.1 amino acid transporter [Blastococcus sp. TF02A_35]
MLSSTAWTAVLAGLGLGLSLIIAIGAQNAFVLRQGLRVEHVGAVVAVCALSDVVLICAGVLGAGALLLSRPGLLTAVCFAGAAFLLVYGAMAARRALRPAGALAADESGARTALAVTVATCLGLTWLNPHVYLDTVVLLGSLSTTYAEDRWWFAAGAAVGSAAWFTGLGFGARLLRPVFARPAAWRVLDAVIAVVMTALGVSLAVRGLSGG